MPDQSDVSVEGLLLRIVCSFVEYPQAITLNTVWSDDGAMFAIRAHTSDVGKLIGQQGQTAKSLRVIVSAVGKKLQRRYPVSFDEDEPA
jgi:predicted RNA-binding protein YlqC (UPF0109 family)